MTRKKKLIFSSVAGIILAIASVYYFLVYVPLDELSKYFYTVDYFWILPSFFCVLLGYMARGLRWKVILDSSCSLNYYEAYHPMMIGFMLNNFLPGRIGEVARPVILKRRSNISFATGLATIASERLFDMLVMLGILFFVLVNIDIDPSIEYSFGDYLINVDTLISVSNKMLFLLLIIIIAISILAFEKPKRFVTGLVRMIPKLMFFTTSREKKKVEQLLSVPIEKFVEDISSGFLFARDYKKVILILGLSIFVWCIQAVSCYVMALGCPGVNGLSVFEHAAVMVIIGFFIALPSVPGFWGLWEAGGLFALSLFSISPGDAAGYTLVNHAVQVFSVSLLGLCSVMVASRNSIWSIIKESMK